MDRGSLRIRCACGWETAGGEEEVVAATVEHGRRLHNMTPTRDEVLAMVLPPDESPTLGFPPETGLPSDPR